MNRRIALTRVSLQTIVCGLAAVSVGQAAAQQSTISSALLSQWMTPNGYSGTGIIPRASTLPVGTSTIDFNRAIPGAAVPYGYNYQFGVGVTESLEATYRLATQSLACNFFTGECPANTIRDLSGSVKWAPQLAWLRDRGLKVAFGASDIGGAATNFRNYYAVLGGDLRTLGVDRLDWTAGYANGVSGTSPLNKVFGGIDYRPTDWSFVSLQRTGDNTSAHGGISIRVPSSRVELLAAVHGAIGDSRGYPKQWGSVGLNVPLAAVTQSFNRTPAPRSKQAIKPVLEGELPSEFARQGFHQTEIKRTPTGTLQVVAENTAFPHSVMDAMGVALGILAGLDGSANAPHHIELIITQRLLPVAWSRATPKCLADWLRSEEAACSGPEIRALAHESPVGDPGETSIDRGPWWTWKVRPELIVTPVITSTIGTEVGAYDADLGYTANVVMPLWRGATLDWAYLRVPGWRTGEFKDGGYYATERLREGVARRMFHQVLDISRLNTQVRLSVGRGFSVWDGRHLETVTTSPGGAHRIGVIAGRFTGPIPVDPFFGLPFVDAERPKRQYELMQYRWAHGPSRTWHTELTGGTFWGMDKGAQVTQRFWFADSNVAVYYRRSQMPEADRPVSFAGIQLTIPLTPRRSLTTAYGTARPTNAWSYAIESKVQETDNIITRGFGEVPRFGETITTLYNRDRYDGTYLREHHWRLREAFHRLTRD